MSAWTSRSFDGKAAPKIAPPRLRIPCGRAWCRFRREERAGDRTSTPQRWWVWKCLTLTGRLEKRHWLPGCCHVDHQRHFVRQARRAAL